MKSVGFLIQFISIKKVVALKLTMPPIFQNFDLVIFVRPDPVALSEGINRMLGAITEADLQIAVVGVGQRDLARGQ